VECQASATGDEVIMGDKDYIPFYFYEELEALREGEIA